MKHFLSLIILLLIFTYGCDKNPSQSKAPENLISIDTMVEILVDFHLIEAAIKIDQKRKVNMTEYTKYYYNYLFEKHQITKEDFKESLAYYQNNPSLFEEMYADVITQLSRIQSEIDSY